MTTPLFSEVARSAMNRPKVSIHRRFNPSNTPLLPAKLLGVVNQAPRLVFNTDNILARKSSNVEKFAVLGDTKDQNPKDFLNSVTAGIRDHFTPFPDGCKPVTAAVFDTMWSVEQHDHRIVLTATYDGDSTNSKDYIAEVLKIVPDELEAGDRKFSIAPLSEQLINVESFLMVYPVDASYQKSNACLSFLHLIDDKPRIFSVNEVKKSGGLGFTIFNVAYSATRLPPSSGRALPDVRAYDSISFYPLTYRGTYCRYCKSKAHDRANCPEAPECFKCKSTAHPSRHCKVNPATTPLPSIHASVKAVDKSVKPVDKSVKAVDKPTSKPAELAVATAATTTPTPTIPPSNISLAGSWQVVSPRHKRPKVTPKDTFHQQRKRFDARNYVVSRHGMKKRGDPTPPTDPSSSVSSEDLDNSMNSDNDSPEGETIVIDE